LTGVAAGERNGDGTFAAGTAFALLDARLSEMAQTLKGFR
jgi:hypothetical protein